MGAKLYQFRRKLEKKIERFKEKRKQKVVKEPLPRSFSNHKKRGRI